MDRSLVRSRVGSRTSRRRMACSVRLRYRARANGRKPSWVQVVWLPQVRGDDGAEHREHEAWPRPHNGTQRIARVQFLDRDGAALHQENPSRLRSIWRRRHHRVRSVDVVVRMLPRGYGAPPRWDVDRSCRRNQGIRTEQLPVGDTPGAGSEQAHTAPCHGGWRNEVDC